VTELRGLYTLWLREVKRYLRDRIRIVSSFVQPVLWLLIFGKGIGSSLSGAFLPNGVSYPQYLFPGIIGQTLLFTSMFMGISVIWDREFGFLKEIMVAPISRVAVFLGKMLGDCTDAVIQGVIVFILGFVLGIRLDAVIFLQILPIMLLMTFGLVSVGLVIASFMENLESYGVIQSFVNLPLFFLSGALFLVSGQRAAALNVPGWMQTASYFNPLTYGVDALRSTLLGGAWETYRLFPLYYELSVIACFDLAMILIGTWAFSRRK
jgi:ABC-2 type transport system permease protein